MEFIARPTPGGGLNLGARNTAIFDDFVKKNPTVPWKLTPVLPESNKQRRYLEGAVIPLVAFYAQNYDHRNTDHLREMREWLKMEFNSSSAVINGHVHQVAKSTKDVMCCNPSSNVCLDGCKTTTSHHMRPSTLRTSNTGMMLYSPTEGQTTTLIIWCRSIF